MLRELSPSPIIFVEYERRRYFNWFVVCWSFLKMEGDGNLFPDGWFLDADDPSPAPPEADDPSPAPPEADDPSEAPPANFPQLFYNFPSSATTSPAVLQLPKQCYNFQPQCYNFQPQCYNFQPQCYNFHLGSTAPLQTTNCLPYHN